MRNGRKKKNSSHPKGTPITKRRPGTGMLRLLMLEVDMVRRS
jgi:hypothetical protein